MTNFILPVFRPLIVVLGIGGMPLLRPILVSLGLALTAQAVVISSGGPNNTAPVGQPFFGNVGVLNGASAIYLDNQWVMTAAHVAGSLPASVSFGGTSYATQAGSWQRLTNTGLGSGLTALADVVLFRITSSPGLPTLTLRTGAPVAGDDVMMVGNGRIQAANLTYWNVNVVTGPGNDVWTEVTLPAIFNRSGFKTTAANEVRWGNNEVGTANTTVNTGGGDTRSFSTVYNAVNPEEAQGAVGDSGGATLFFNGSNWELAGMMHAIATFETQPSLTAVSGNSTFHANLSLYAPQINAILVTVPEPSSYLIAGIAGLLCLTKRLR
jgi:hypothetical protein